MENEQEVTPEAEVIDGDLQQEFVKIRAKGKLYEGYLHELDGEQRDGYLDGQLKNSVAGPGGKTSIRSFKNQTANLIHLCFRTLAGAPVPVPEIQTWSSTAQDKLFDKCQRLNALGPYQKKALAAAKNDSSANDSPGDDSPTE